SARLLGAEKVIGIDRVPARLRLARQQEGVEVIDYSREDVQERLAELTGGRGPDACIDAVGMEAHGFGLQGWYDWVKTNLYMETDRPIALREAIIACRKG